MIRRSTRASRARVAVVGGGVAGCATAIALAQSGVLDVLVLEARASPRERVGETIPPDARRLFGRLGLGAAFDAEGHAPCYGSASSWGAGELGYNDHLVHPLGHGYHLDRRRFDAWMGKSAERAGVQRVVGARVTDVQWSAGGWQLHVSHERSSLTSGPTPSPITADFVVDATGVRSAIGRQLGARRLHHDRMTYLACTLAAPDRPLGQTWLEATRDGYWYAAELPGGVVTLAIATDAEVVRARELFTHVGFARAFAGTLHLLPLLGHLPYLRSEPVAWSAQSSLLGPPAGTGWLAVGDAAAAYDPICARGIHKALEDGLRAATAVRATLSGDTDAVADFARHTILAFRAYLEQRALLYAQESRWPDALFWRRRSSRRNLIRGESPADSPSYTHSRLENSHVQSSR